MRLLRHLVKQISHISKDEEFLELIEKIQTWISKILSLAMIVVIIIAVIDIIIIIGNEILVGHSIGRFNNFLVAIFGIFLNVLIAIEILENITAYLRKHVIQAELVIVTSLIAIARKIIILDFAKTDGLELIGLGIAVFALAITYWIIKSVNTKRYD